MPTSPLITAAGLQALLAAGTPPQIVDCSFDLADPGAGERLHTQARLPGALYLHLDHHLSGAKNAPGLSGGRHPLPTREAFAATLGAQGLRNDQAIVVYDQAGGMYAARAWWMLRWLGHAAVQVLDGGIGAWQAAGGALHSGPPATGPARPAFALQAPLEATLDYATLRAELGTPGRLIVDARAPDRFRGENETLDPVGGHIPGALNRVFRLNLGAEGAFKPAAQLRAEWLALMAGRPAHALVMQCGSGVTACHNLLALQAAGLDGARLYPGSWSEWCRQPDAVVATG
ncbi:sulfurtransferase [Aquabacterium sp. OR-4]|uniref:sulfurtransferase n=1 Tax=Aquabacterium sp. OR-4 TaxID=2978127 RepID=UPI0021B31EAC|nr:sulfurtransferase [Aquabacterium sp. OR-4]MDT7836426.1 sulfurtransferase [Aquabacterium sp. OR-4]